jgi:hypothetical protein
MSRLRHDLRPYLMTLRMTRTDLIVFVEGIENDPIFYPKLADRFSKAHLVAVEIRRAQELPGSAPTDVGGSGGKSWLIKAGRFWLQYGSTRSFNCRVLFALDKDIDDVRGKLLNDPHFVYTEGYAVENYMVSDSNLQATAENALSLMPQELAPVIGSSQSTWLKNASALWREWVQFCIVASCYRHSKKVRGYSSPSRVNSPHHASCDLVELDRRYEILRLEASAPLPEFNFVRKQVETFVLAQYAASSEDRLMKGEWYIDILLAQVQNNPILWGRSVQSGKHGIWSAIRQNITISNAVYLYYEVAFQGAIAAPF